MPQVTVRIENIGEIRSAFQKAPVKTTRALNNAIRISALEIERSSKINSPVDTGYLRASHRSTFRTLYGEVMPTAKYAIYVHEGTRKMRKRPFLFNAVKSNEGRVQSVFTEKLQGVLNEIGQEV